LLLGTGVLGGFTTYSALAVQTDALLRSGQAVTALTYAAGTVALGLAASIAGIIGTRWALAR
jgi:CrcB protein